jgi:hypothetical protein
MPDTSSLAGKLGIAPGATVTLLHAPKDFSIELPAGALLRRQVRKGVDVVLAFYSSNGVLEAEIERLSQVIFPDGSFWISWPKKSSGVKTDLDDHVIRDLALPRGLVDNKVCAIDETFTALRFVWRRSLRNERRPPPRA